MANNFFEVRQIHKECMSNKLPNHIAFIMDGNGRWAKMRGLPRSAGHRAGARALKKVVAAVAELKIPFMTVYAFSTENWARPKDEIDTIFEMIMDFNKKELKNLLEQNICVKFIGSRDGLSEDLIKSIDTISDKTSVCTGTTLNIAFNYGGREDILQAVNHAVELGQPVSAKQFENLLYTSGQPMPDIIVRSSGEYRLSNFLLYQAAYAELFFVKALWPDFNKKQIDKILEEYSSRDRRFGGATQENA